MQFAQTRTFSAFISAAFFIYTLVEMSKKKPKILRIARSEKFPFLDDIYVDIDQNRGYVVRSDDMSGVNLPLVYTIAEICGKGVI